MTQASGPLQAEIERRQRVAEALRDLMAVVNSNHDLDEILAKVLAQSSRLLGNDASALCHRNCLAPRHRSPRPS